MLFCVIALLQVCSWIPKFSIGDFEFKPIELFSDIQKEKQTVQKQAENVTHTVEKKDTHCPSQLTCITDWSEGHNQLDNFFQALANIKKNKQSVRIGFFGDSFIEGDMILAQLRDTLQQRFGGHGVGFVPITSIVAKNRPTIEHDFDGWETYTLLDNKKRMDTQLGFSGEVFMPRKGAVVEYRVPSLYRIETLSHFSQANVWYKSKTPIEIVYQINHKQYQSAVLPATEEMTVFKIAAEKIQSVRIECVSQVEEAQFYGVTLDGEPGVYVDNFSLRGNPGPGLMRVQKEMYQRMQTLQPYHLIVLEYGLNVSGGSKVGLNVYTQDMDSTLRFMRACFPNTPILLMGVSDRGSKVEGEIQTPPQIHFLREMQSSLAQKHELLYWSTYEAMGGENSMVKFVEEGLANKDYTHLKFTGGGVLAKKLATALFFEQQKYTTEKRVVQQ